MTELLGYTATLLFSLMMLPQLVKSLRTRDARGVSPWPFAVGVLANAVALVYAYRIRQDPLLLKYSFALLVLVACLVAYSRCER